MAMLHANTQLMGSQELKELHKLLVDSRRNYVSVAKRVEDEQVKDLLLDIADQQTALEEELGEHLGDGKHNAADHGTLGGTLGRLGFAARDLLNNTSEVNLLVECEREQANLTGQYDQLLNQGHYAPETRTMLERQRAISEGFHRSVIAMRESLESVDR